MKVFSTEWAAAYQQAINASGDYATASAGWEAGKLALVIQFGDGGAQAVLLDLLRGKCLQAQSVGAEAAAAEAAFVIAGDEATWRDVLAGNLQPLMGIMRGKLKLTHGSISRLMPYTSAATELVRCAQGIPTEF